MDQSRRGDDDGKNNNSNATDSVKRLLKRWELSSTTGTPLHPSLEMDELRATALAAETTPPSLPKRILTVRFSTEPPDVSQLSSATNVTVTTSATPGSSTADRKSSTDTDKGIQDHSSTTVSSIDLFAEIEKGLRQEGLLKVPTTPTPAPTDQEEGDGSATSQFSVSAYRKKSLIDRRGANRMGQAIDTDDSNLTESPQSDRTPNDDDGTTVAKLSSDDEDVGQAQGARMKRLREAMSAQQAQILQARHAIAVCRRDEKFSGGRQEIEAQMALLLASERRNALQAAHETILAEIADQTERTEEIGGGVPTTRPIAAYEPRGTLSISRISIQLSEDFREKSGFVDERFYLVALIKFCDGTVRSTQLTCTDEDDGEGWLELQMTHGGIKLKDLRPDFNFQLEIYRLRSYESLVVMPVKPKGGKGKMGGLFKMFTKRTSTYQADTSSSVGERVDTSDSNVQKSRLEGSKSSRTGKSKEGGGELRQKSVADPFQLAGSIKLKSSECSHQQEFKLTEPLHPLEGSVHIKASYSIYLQKTTVDDGGNRKKGSLRRRY